MLPGWGRGGLRHLLVAGGVTGGGAQVRLRAVVQPLSDPAVKSELVTVNVNGCFQVLTG